MGLLTWIVASIVAFFACRRIPSGRSPSWQAELALSLIAGIAAGIAATALDFGGWNEMDPFAASFAGLISCGAIALRRLAGLWRHRNQGTREIS